MAAEEAQRASRASRWSEDLTQEGDYELWPEHEHAWDVFLDCARQWRIVAGMGGVWYAGLDAASVLASLQMLRVPRGQWREVRGQLAVLEDEALAHLNRRD